MNSTKMRLAAGLRGGEGPTSEGGRNGGERGGNEGEGPESPLPKSSWIE